MAPVSGAVVVTGASTGIGYDAARYLIDRGYEVFGSVRRPADGERAQAALGDRFTPLLMDVTDETAVQQAAAIVAGRLKGRNLRGLVNNAGIAIPGPLMHLPLADFRRQFEVNVIGVMAVTQAFLPLLGANEAPIGPPGRIVNISSVSGRITYPFLGPYAASKHALEALSDALRRELLVYGIDVVVIEPGSVKTPIWDKAEAADLARYNDTRFGSVLGRVQQVMVEGGQSGMAVERVSALIVRALEHPRPKTRYVLLRRPLTGWLLPRFLPDRWVDRMVARRLGLKG